jgi:hypothetical protein
LVRCLFRRCVSSHAGRGSTSCLERNLNSEDSFLPMIPPHHRKRLRRVEVGEHPASNLRGRKNPWPLQRPPHPGPLPPLGRAEREKVSTSADSTRTELRFTSALRRPRPGSPRQLGLWRNPAFAGVPLSAGERARVRAGVNSIVVHVRSSSSSVRQPKRQLRSAPPPHSKTLARSFHALPIRGHSRDSRTPSSAFRLPPSHFTDAPR